MQFSTQYNANSSVHSTIHTVQYDAHNSIYTTMYTVQYTVQCTQFSTQYDAHSSIYSIIHTFQYSLMHTIQYKIQYIQFSTQYEAYSPVHSVMQKVQYTIWCTYFSNRYTIIICHVAAQRCQFSSTLLMLCLADASLMLPLWLILLAAFHVSVTAFQHCLLYETSETLISMSHTKILVYKYLHTISNCIIDIPILNINRMKQHSFFRSNITGIFIWCTYSLIT